VRESRQKMSDQQQPPVEGVQITTNAPIHGQVVTVGQSNTVTAHITQGASALDRAALHQSLLELYTSLGTAGLPLQVQMEAQTATGLASRATQVPEAPGEALATQIQQVGEAVQRAGVKLEEGSHLASSILKVAQMLGPLVVGGAHEVARWFGVPLP
jgi:hypothetical protein